MRRFRQQITEEECETILREEPRGVLSMYGEDGYPYAIPINFIYDGRKIYFHCAKEGHKIDALKKDNRVSFCVYDKGYLKEGKVGLNINSVVIFGKIRFIDDRETVIRETRALGMKYLPEDLVEKDVKKYAETGRLQILELTIDHMTGKLVNES